MHLVCYTMLHLLALKSCDFRAGAAKAYFIYYEQLLAAKMYFVHYTCTEKLRLSSRNCQSVLRILHLNGKVTTFELELPNHCKPMLRKNGTDR